MTILIIVVIIYLGINFLIASVTSLIFIQMQKSAWEVMKIFFVCLIMGLPILLGARGGFGRWR